MNDFNATVIADFKANGGKPGGYFANAPVLLLHCIGAKSGEPRMQPLMFQKDGDGPWYIFASYAGGPNNPAWYHNLVANPDAEIEVGDGNSIDRIAVHAEVLGESDRAAVYAEQARRFPQFAEYEKKTSRETIPVVALTRR
jgi:deazaflavin-dependent oxidoreductase (nitroreductase family)